MIGRRRWLWLVILAVVVMLVGLWQDKRQTKAPVPPPAPSDAAATKPVVDLTRHDGQTIDFSSGRPVVKDSPAERAALAKTVREMEAAAADVTFTPPSSTAAAPAKPPAK